MVGGGGDGDLIRFRFCIAINGMLHLATIVKFPLGVLVFSKIDLKSYSSSSSCSYFNGVVVDDDEGACSFNFF